MIPPRHPARLPRLLAGLVLVAAIALPLPAFAAHLAKVRAGSHGEFTRVVFELDAATGYRIEKAGTKSAPMLRVTLDAGTRFHRVRAHGDVEGVKVAAGERAVATIALGRSDLRVQEMILANPPRIVLDLYRPESALAKKSERAPKKSTVSAPEPVAKAPGPKPVEEKAAPESVASKTPAPKPQTRSTPSPQPEAVAGVEPAPSPPVARTEPKAAPKPALVLPSAPIARVDPAEPETAPEEAKPAAPAPTPAIQPKPPARISPPEPAPKPVAKVAPVAPRPAPTPASWTDRVLGDPILQGGIAAAVVAIVAIAVIVRRRYRALPNDLDVTAIAEEVEGSGRHPADGFAMDEAPTEAAMPTAEAAMPAAEAAMPAAEAAMPAAEAAPTHDAESSFAGLFDDEPQTSGAPDTSAAEEPVSSIPDSTPATRVTAASADPAESLFEDTGGHVGERESSEGDAPMNQDMDLPANPSSTSQPPVMGGAASPSPDVTQMLQEFERRMQTLEARLDEANEAREKLERQVAAQSEELRVQRAAIARTQRALRTMSRSDEDKATEPALREGDTQAKTRVNV